jgi:unsaturated rhamnogalacturonyl hydrolase
MIGEFLLEMYRATGDEKYLEELVKQIALHREKLQVKEWGLWVHGYDQDGWGHCLFCSEVHWASKTQKQSAEIWGRGNGWIVVTLSDVLSIVPRTHPLWNELAGYLKEMVQHLPELQDKKTGHWYQLPVRNNEQGNFIESSCTAMFGYGINTAIQLGLVSDEVYKTSVQLAYSGLRSHSVHTLPNGYLTTQNVCSATCIGDKEYYFKRSTQQGKAYGLAVFMLFGRSYETGLGYRK